jgi:hypothetical protein
MRSNQSEIVEEILAHIQECGGEANDWRVGTARDSDTGHGARDTGHGNAEAPGAGCQENEKLEKGNAKIGERTSSILTRQAYTSYAADEVVERLVSMGLQRDRESAPGQIVFVYRKEAVSDQLRR